MKGFQEIIRNDATRNYTKDAHNSNDTRKHMNWTNNGYKPINVRK